MAFVVSGVRVKVFKPLATDVGVVNIFVKALFAGMNDVSGFGRAVYPIRFKPVQRRARVGCGYHERVVKRKPVNGS